MTLVTPLEFEDAEVNDTDRPRPKVGRIPVKLRLNNEDAARETYVDTSLNSRKGDTQFMMLLVALFIIVNLSLITLLNQKSKNSAAQQPAVAANTTPVAPAASITAPVQPTAIPAIAPSTTTAPIVQQKPVAATAPLPLPASPASASVSATPQTPAGYITPVTPETVKATAAPFHKVTVTEHAPVAAPASVDTRLTVIHAAQEAPASEAAKLAPAAGATAPAAAAPAPVAAPAVTATQDLLSVINKD